MHLFPCIKVPLHCSPPLRVVWSPPVFQLADCVYQRGGYGFSNWKLTRPSCSTGRPNDPRREASTESDPGVFSLATKEKNEQIGRQPGNRHLISSWCMSNYSSNNAGINNGSLLLLTVFVGVMFHSNRLVSGRSNHVSLVSTQTSNFSLAPFFHPVEPPKKIAKSEKFFPDLTNSPNPSTNSPNFLHGHGWCTKHP